MEQATQPRAFAKHTVPRTVLIAIRRIGAGQRLIVNPGGELRAGTSRTSSQQPPASTRHEGFWPSADE